jgi:hypothetical protein
MKAEYKFLRTRDGTTSFAKIDLVSEPSPAWGVTWSSSIVHAKSTFGDAVERGIRVAASAHEKAGGAPQSVEVVALADTVSDTRTDAVVCAAALAAWSSWGHPESDVIVAYQDGEWRVLF